VIEVRAELPGTSPDELATRVTTSLERALASVPHIAGLTSETTAGATRLRVMLDGNDTFAGVEAVRVAVTGVARQLPAEMSPPTIAVPGVPAGRYVVPRARADRAVAELERTPGVARVERCGEQRVERAIDLDVPRLAALGVTVSDVVTAVRAAAPADDLGRLPIATHAGAPVYMSDVAQIHDASEPPACALVAPSQDVVELVVDTQAGASADALHAAVTKLGVDAVPRRREQHAQLALDTELAKGPTLIRDALARAGGGYLVEVRGHDVRIVDGGEPVLAALHQLAFVTGGGEPTSVVHVTGADPRAVAEAARSISDKLRHAGTLVATHGLATATTLRLDIDRDRAAAFGVRASDVTETLAATAGIVATTSFTATDAQHVVVRMPDVRTQDFDGLFVHGTGGVLVPLASVVTTHETTEPVEILHRSGLPDIDLEVHGTPAIGAVPAGVRVEVEPYR
jgi:multidrug efflux pump subunit AcrB